MSGKNRCSSAGETSIACAAGLLGERHESGVLPSPALAFADDVAAAPSAPGVLTRRSFAGLIAAGLTAAAAGALTGCSDGSSGDGGSKQQGFASDTVVANAAVTIYIVADENLKRAMPGSDNGRLEDYFKRYQAQAGREQVTFAVKYKSASELERLAEKGFGEGTAVVGLEQLTEAACNAGTLYGGAANTSMRSFPAQLTEQLIVVRKAGSNTEMPKSDTVSGDDSSDGQISRMQHLADFKGKIAIASEDLTEGMLANRVLARWGYYSDESGCGGKYSKEIAGKIVVYDTLDKLVTALNKGKCQLAFAVQSMLWGDFNGIEQVYQPAYGTLVYGAASIPDAENDAVARDFFEFITRCS